MARRISRSLLYRIRRPVVVVGVMLLIVVLRFLTADVSQSPVPDSLSEGAYRVQRVVDGDTLVLEGGARVRLIGADSPETVKPDHPVQPYGPEARDYTEQFISEAGGKVRVQMDRQRKDRFDRFLAYVFVDDRMLNEELIREGLATARTEFDYSQSMKRRFCQAQDEAKSAGRGLWSSASP